MRIRFLTVLAAAAAMTASLAAPQQALADGYSSYKGGPAPAPVMGSGRTYWEGFHVGAQIGGAEYDYGVSQTAPASALTTIDDDGDGVVGGVVYGTSWQFNRWVLGTDSEYSFANADSGLNVTGTGLTATADVKWSSTSRLRAGVLLTPTLLLYGTVGVAYSKVDVSGTLIAGGKDDESFWGVVYGGGVETNFNSRWFARVEYLHADYGDEDFVEVGGGLLNVDLDTDVVRGAVGYRFDWDPFDLLKN